MFSYRLKIINHDQVKKITKNKNIQEIVHESLPENVHVTFLSEAEQVLYYKIKTTGQTLLLHLGLEPVTPQSKDSLLRQTYDFFKKNPKYLKLHVENIFHQISLKQKNAYPFFFSEFPKGYKSYVSDLQLPEILETLAEIIAKNKVSIRLDNKTILLNPETKEIKLLQVKKLPSQDEKNLFDAIFVDFISSIKEPNKKTLEALMRGSKRGLENQKWSDQTLEEVMHSLETESFSYPLKESLHALVDGEIFENLMSDDDFFIDQEILKDEESDKKTQAKEMVDQ